MLRDDYLLRLIEQVGRMVARLRELLLKGEVIVESELKQSASAAGFDLGLLRAFTPESLFAMVRPAGTPDALRCVLIAELLTADALMARHAGDDLSVQDRVQKVGMLLEAAEADPDAVRRSLVADRVAKLRAIVLEENLLPA
jgi:hypothetical protein